MDGKQARKTKQGSPLGMLFDHGLDAFNAFITAVNISKLCYAAHFQQAICVTVILTLAYLATIEQYITDYFYLPKINSVNEGLLLLFILQMVGAYIGAPFWRQTPYLGLRWNEYLAISLVVMGIVNSANQ
jgi:ethanolaminephosphotransferase